MFLIMPSANILQMVPLWQTRWPQELVSSSDSTMLNKSSSRAKNSDEWSRATMALLFEITNSVNTDQMLLQAAF